MYCMVLTAALKENTICAKKSPLYNFSDIYPKILKERIVGAVIFNNHFDVWKFVVNLLNMLIYCDPPDMFSTFWYSRGRRPFYAHVAITPPTLPSLA